MNHPVSCLRIALLAALCVVMSACSSGSRDSSARVCPDEERMSAVANIRAANAGEDSALQVNPLRDPAVEGYLARAEDAEKRGELAAALAEIVKARALAADAPDLIQRQAELEYLLGDIVNAEKLAYQSFEKGPKVGTLCVQNWQTIYEARKHFADAAYLDFAQRKREECKAKRPPRF